MKILFLDDDHSRCGAFHWANKDTHDLTIVHTVDEAIRALQDGSWDIISLDHDLEPQHYENLEGKHDRSGMAVAEWIAENAPDIVGIIIHSWNPWGAANMARVLVDAGFSCVRREFNHQKCAI